MGTVGQGVASLLLRQKDFWRERLGYELTLRRILEKYPDKTLDFDREGVPISADWRDVVDDPEVQIVVETMGGIEPAKTFILEALRRGKHVVTANKDLLALHGRELFAAASERGADLYFEASVAGAVPVLCALRQNLIAEPLTDVIGIVNGTTNYILTRMAAEGGEFGEILADAQKLGYAEFNPASDVEGIDAGRKAAILSMLSFNSQVTLDDVYVEGITGITREDIAFADQMGFAVKLLAVCREREGKIEARVHPALLPKGHPLAGVGDTFNAVLIKGESLGEVMLYGRGAGRFPTASAILGDVSEIARNIRFGCCGRLNQVFDRLKPVMPIDEIKTRFFLRLLLADRPGVLAQITKTLGKHEVSLDTVRQTDLKDGDAELVFITHIAREGDMRQALKEMGELEVTKEIITVLRVEGVA
jgi:homoserine dehydrogenase